jgi:hypothetical protein
MKGDEYDDGDEDGYTNGHEMQPDYVLSHGVDADMSKMIGMEAAAEPSVGRDE